MAVSVLAAKRVANADASACSWVNSVLRRLEAGVIEQCDVMHREGRQQLPSLTATEDPATGELFGGGRTISPEPPLPSHPLHPRPRASAIVHGAAPGTEPGTGREHLEVSSTR